MYNPKSSSLRIHRELKCTNGCGFYGNAQFNGLCSKCFRERSHSHSDRYMSQLFPIFPHHSFNLICLIIRRSSSGHAKSSRSKREQPSNIGGSSTKTTNASRSPRSEATFRDGKNQMKNLLEVFGKKSKEIVPIEKQQKQKHSIKSSLDPEYLEIFKVRSSGRFII